MKTMDPKVRKGIAVAALVVIALLSAFVLAGRLSDPAFHAGSIAALDEKKVTVTELTAAAAAGSVAVSAIPGDATTPIANQIAEMATYLLIVVGAILLEKFLLTMTCLVTFQYLIPAACVLTGIWLFTNRAVLLRLAMRLAAFGLVICLVVPASLQVSALMEDTFDTQQTVEQVQQAADELEQEEAAEQTQDGGLGDWLSGIGETITAGVSGALERAEQMLSRFIDAVAVLIITNCVLPVAVLLFFIWVTKIIFGIQLPATARGAAGAIHGRFRRKRAALREASARSREN